MPGYDTFNETLKTHALDAALIAQINAGFEDLTGRAARPLKRDYFRHAMDVLDRSLSRDARIDLLDDNACCRANTARAKASVAFAKAHADKSLAERLPLIAHVPNMGTPSLTEEGKLAIAAVQYFRDGQYRCSCPSINTRKKHELPLSRTYCMCCAGHFRYHYQILLGCALRLNRVAQSPLDSDGREPCAFVFDFVE